MKKQVKDELEKMIKSLSKENAKNGREEYTIEVTRFDRGAYSVVIRYRVMFSPDLDKLFTFTKMYDLNTFLGAGGGCDFGRIYIQ